MANAKTPAPKSVVRLNVQETEMVAIDEVTEHPDNPRRGDVRMIAESIEKNGWYGSIIVQRSTKHILAGNHSHKAARALHMAEVPVTWVDVDDDTAKRILLADNRVADVGGYDDQALTRLLSELAVDDTLHGTGYNNDDLEAMLAILEREAPPTALELEEAAQNMRDRVAAQPRLVIDTTTEIVARFDALPGDTAHDKLVGILPPATEEPASE